MHKAEQTFRALIDAARTTAAFVVAAWLFSAAEGGMSEWDRMFACQGAAFLTFLGYGVFVMVPICHLPKSVFLAVVAVGVLLAFGSVIVSKIHFVSIVEDLLGGATPFRIMAWSLLIPIYAYIPIVIMYRKHMAVIQDARNE